VLYNKIIWIHRMAAILSEIKNKLSISALKDRLTDVYSTVNDKVVRVKEALSVAPEEKPDTPSEAKLEEKKEAYADPPVPKTTKDKIFDFLNKVKDYVIIAGTIFLKFAFYIFLASVVANDMIIYSPVIRAFFFVFTLIITYTLPPYAFFLTCYYALRKGYDYYHQKLSSEKVKPPISFPMIFAILPLTTTYPESPIVRFFMWAFMYQKSDKPERMERENDRLEIIMTEYWKDLNKSFDYLDKIKTNEPFSRLYELNKEHLERDYMHPIQKPETVVQPSKTLPDVIGEKKEEEKKEEKKVTFFKPQSIEQANKEAANNEAAIKAAAIKAVENKATPIKAVENKATENKATTVEPMPPVLSQSAETPQQGSVPSTI